MNYFTLQIQYGGSADPEKIEFKDLSPQLKDEKIWMREVRTNLWQSGFQIETAPGNYEFISPFRIHTAHLLRQDSKYSI